MRVNKKTTAERGLELAMEMISYNTYFYDGNFHAHINLLTDAILTVMFVSQDHLFSSDHQAV